MKKETIGQQGEVAVYKIIKLPAGMQTAPVRQMADGSSIISHSESGNHHVIAGAEIMERTDNVPAGMRILYAIVENPTSLKQDAGNPHGSIALDPGIYELRISREYNPFAEEVRLVAD